MTHDDVTVVPSDKLKRAVVGTAVGNGMEWFDFGLHAYLAVVIGHVFFAGSSPTVQLLGAFAAFAVAFLMRPIGGLVFGPLGDRIGRKKVLALTIVLMSAATFMIGILPTYAEIGIWAPVLLVLARLVQGFSTGGEYSGATTFIAEYSPDKRRGFLGSWLEFGTLTGYSLGAALVTTIKLSSTDEFLYSWGWRIPFLIAGPLGLIGLYLRLKLEDTPAYEQTTDDNANGSAESSKSKQSFGAILAAQWPALLRCIGLVVVFNVTNYMVTTYMPTYLTKVLGYNESIGLLIVLSVMVLMASSIVFIGKLSDRIGRRPLIMAGSIALIVASWPLFMLIQEGSMLTVFACVFALGAMLICFSSTMPSTLPALFPTAVRYSALAIGFNVSVSLFGGTTPLIAESLVAGTGNNTIPAVLLIVAGVVGAISVYFTKESANRPLPGAQPAVGSKHEARELIREHNSRPDLAPVEPEPKAAAR